MKSSVIYYTDNRLEDPLYSFVQDRIADSGLPIFSASLEPIDFGFNEVIEGKRCYTTMLKQIISCLSRSPTDYVFFCEHDVLYHLSHFEFTPPKDDVFYYNENVWRWAIGADTVIRHHRMIPLSTLCANRLFALDHYKKRLEKIESKGLEDVAGREPSWVRKMGYEPGTKKKRRGGFSDDKFGTWHSKCSNIDVRHKGTFSNSKTKLEDFKHKPKWWL